MRINFFDDDKVTDLYPLTLTRPAADLRCGIMTIAEKWAKILGSAATGHETRDYLSAKFAPLLDPELRINGRIMPSAAVSKAITALAPGEQLYEGETLVAERPGDTKEKFKVKGAHWVNRPYDLFIYANEHIGADIKLLCKGRTSAVLSSSNKRTGKHSIFVEEGAIVECAVLNASKGPIYIGKNAEVMEGSLIRGPFSMGEGAVLKMGAKVYGATALGPYCVAGGEVSNVLMQGYSNKGHDGFLGNAVLGEWCNIGADSNCSNLKNTYDEVKVWNYSTNKFEKSGQQFCGLIMGDHSKCAINTMFNTGTVVGVAANIFGAGFPRQFIPDFSWGGASGFVTYKLDAAKKTAALVMPRRKKEFDKVEEEILERVFEITEGFRNF